LSSDSGRTIGSALHLVRFAIGWGCVVTAVIIAAVHVPRVVQAMNGSVRAAAYLQGPEDRVITSGDSMGVARDLQVEALELIPPGSEYAVFVPADRDLAATKYGIQSVTYDILMPWFRYLLLPSVPTSDPSQAHYIVCWGCDRAVWDKRTTWLWDNGQGQSIGKVRR
jgi:hypothetical protein